MTGQEFRETTDRLIGQAHETLNQFIGYIHEIQHSGFEVAEENERLRQEAEMKDSQIKILNQQLEQLTNPQSENAEPTF